MSGLQPSPLHAEFAKLRSSAKLRALASALAVAMPPGVAAAVLAAQIGGSAAAISVATVVLIAALVLGLRNGRKFDGTWLVRQLDAAYPQFEDSTALAVLDRPAATGLPELQQARLQASIERTFSTTGLPDLRAPYPRRAIGIAVLIAALLLALAAAMPALLAARAGATRVEAIEHAGAAINLIEARLVLTPPAYTGLPVQTVSTTDAKAPVDSRIVWSLRFDRDPSDAALRFSDGSRLALKKAGATWQAERTLSASVLYRLELDGQESAASERSWRLDAVPDQPPEITVRAPEKTLTVLTEAQKTWDFSIEARDDYGLGAAELLITRAEGTGEQVKVTEQKIALDGGGDRLARRYRKSLDLAALGFAQGDDLIVRLSVADEHQPQPNISTSASYILRWPAKASSSSAGLEGPVQKVLPAYFRSQRQIIIDTEALIAGRGSLVETKFGRKSDELGIDQKVLRLRYGQFLGEGFESLAEHAQVEAAEKQQQDRGAARSNDDDAPAESLKDVPPEKEAPEVARNGLGQAEDVLHEYGHAHDSGEAATLLDPQTRRILKLALDEMWQAEGKLRLAEPEAALPYEYKALDYIKQVQQAERIYLARVGLELPQVDAARRLTGERAGLADRSSTAVKAAPVESPAAAIVAALDRGAQPDATALGDWLRANPQASDDALGLLAAADRVQREPDCGDCRALLKAKLWPLLPPPPTALRARRQPDAAAAAWLDALSAGSAP